MRPHPCTLAAALALLAGSARAGGPAGAAAPARAGAPLRVAVVTLDAPPQLAPTARSVAEAFAKKAAASGYEVLGPAAVAEKLGRAAEASLARCRDDAACLANRGRSLGVDRIVGGTLARRGASYRVALVNADARTGARLGGLEREIAVASRRLPSDVADAAPALLRGGEDATGVLSVTTDVPGAEVTVDGVPAGRTPVVRVLKPGRHEVKVELPGDADSEPVWVEVPANGMVEHRPRLHAIPPRDRPNASPGRGSGTSAEVEK